MGDQERKIQEIGLWWGECEGVDWRALWGLGVVNGLGSYEVKVSCVEMESYGVIGSFEGFGERCCEWMGQGHFVVEVDCEDHFEGVVVVY